MASTSPTPAARTGADGHDDFAELAERVRQAGLLVRRPSRYVVTCTLVLLALAGSITWLALVDSFWWQLPNAALLAFLLGRVGLLGHDAGHRQVSRSAWGNALVGFGSTLVVGGSWTWWIDAHDRHHRRPNEIGQDPATDFAVIAMTPEQAASKTGLARFMVRHQALFMLPLMSLYGVSMRIDSLRHLLVERKRHANLELALIVLHVILWVGGITWALGPLAAAGFILVNQAIFGLYVASIFLPNHHGMPVVNDGSVLGFVEHQVLTSRNIAGGRFTDFWFGGLNRQIEHHLFPTAPRANLRKIRDEVRAYCADRGLPYHEAGWRQSFREVFSFLHQIGAVLSRRAGAASR